MESVRADGQTVPVSEVTGVVRSRPVDRPSVRSFLHAVQRPRLGWGNATRTVVAGGAAALITADGSDRFETIRTAADGLFEGLQTPDGMPDDARPRLFGGFAFHEDHTDDEEWQGFPAAQFVLPSIQLDVTVS